MKDCFDEFAELYTQGKIEALIKKMLPYPDASYDSLHSNHPAFRYLINYWDALFFSPIAYSIVANQVAGQQLNALQEGLDRQVLHRLKDEEAVLKNLSNLPLAQVMRQFVEAKPELLPFCNIFLTMDNLPHSCLPKELALPTNVRISEVPSLLFFDDWLHLIQCIQFPEIFQAASHPKNRILLLDQHPSDLLHRQKTDLHAVSMLPKIFFSPHRRVQEAIPLLSQSLEQADHFFWVAERILFSIKQEKYGKERSPALVESAANALWYSPHKGRPPKDADLGAEPVNYFPEILRELSQQRLKPAKRLNVTHIMPQIIDYKNAPSHLLETLLLHSNKNRFNCKVIVTERLALHGREYPYARIRSPGSSERGRQRLQKISAAGFPVHVYGSMQNYLEKAHTIAKELQELETDIAIFHGPDIINMMAAQLAPSPLRVLFEHGTPPAYPGFDLMISSTLHTDRFEGFDMQVETLPFCIDLRKTWQKDPPTLESLGLPPDCLPMTTISNLLGVRLGSEMSRAIGAILQLVPKAFYAPIGKVSDEDKKRLLKTFEDLGVADRVKFLGPHINPSQIARCMKLYLNEFPFGSCFGMLDAMASGCVVISMHDPNGPAQARYGAEFMGLDRVIAAGHDKDYVDLAVNLLTDPNLYKEWSDHTLKQYALHADEVQYVKKFEEILLNSFKLP